MAPSFEVWLLISSVGYRLFLGLFNDTLATE